MSMESQIAKQFNISTLLAEEITWNAMNNSMDDLDTEIFEGVLIEYYVKNQQMPYEVMAHGDPFEWVAETIRKELGIE